MRAKAQTCNDDRQSQTEVFIPDSMLDPYLARWCKRSLTSKDERHTHNTRSTWVCQTTNPLVTLTTAKFMPSGEWEPREDGNQDVERVWSMVASTSLASPSSLVRDCQSPPTRGHAAADTCFKGWGGGGGLGLGCSNPPPVPKPQTSLRFGVVVTPLPPKLGFAPPLLLNLKK